MSHQINSHQINIPVVNGSAEPALEQLLPDHERQPCEVWTRVMGYHRPLSEFNPGKQAEHGQRRHFVEVSDSECRRD